MRRELLTWGVIGAFILVAFGSVVLILNTTLYSASGFVASYLTALERRDADAALELAGPSVAGDASAQLLTRDAMGELRDIHLVSDVETDGTHRVVFSYVAGDEPGQTAFEVHRAGALFGLFSTWSFVNSPLAVMHVNVKNDARFSANGVELVSPVPNDPAPYLVFTPGSFALDHESTYLQATTVVVTVTEPGASVPTAVDVQANDDFIAAAQKAVNAHLQDCATQTVLLPTGCPFGYPVSNRIVTPPLWSIITYPVATIEPGDFAGDWRMPRTSATAHIVVDVKSLFDGTITTVDEDVPFSVAYRISIAPGDVVVVSALD
jgi:hypothetical protein